MKLLNLIIVVCLSSFCNGQDSIYFTLKDKTKLEAKTFISKSSFDELFILNENTLTKKHNSNIYNYQNFSLGLPDKVDLLNPLEITLFYKEFNTVIQLDNRLNEINKIDFNFDVDFKPLLYAATASDRRLWLFNTNTKQLELYNYQRQQTEGYSQPITSSIKSIYSNYNFCWILPDTEILEYNTYGALLNTIKMEGYDSIVVHKNLYFLTKNKQLYYFNLNSESPTLLSQIEFPIKDFSVTNESLYIYDGENLYTYSINTLNK